MTRTPLKGVNIGGWLILEKWMTPRVFDGIDAVDEYTLSQTEKGRVAIKNHRESFIQESDFKWLSKHGIKIVRIPVGYWLFEGDGNLLPHISHLDWAMNMAAKYKLEVLIDLHGHKGSQNGQDHSGKAGKSDWFRFKSYRSESLDVLDKIAHRYADHPNLWGLQLINEPPKRLLNLKLRSFYKEAAERLAKILKHTRVIFSDSFTPRLMSGVLSRSTHITPVMDIHVYQPFKPWVKFLPMKIFFGWLRWQKRVLWRLSKKQPIIIGEWSGVIRHEDLMKIPKDERDDFIKHYIQTQIDVFSSAEAWFYWNYKTQEPGVWNYRSLLESGVIK